MDIKKSEETTNARCTQCRTVSPHEWMMVVPIGTVIDAPPDAEPVVNFDAKKRVTLCSHCGYITAKK